MSFTGEVANCFRRITTETEDADHPGEYLYGCASGHTNSTFKLRHELSLDLAATLSVHDHRDSYAGNIKLVRAFAVKSALEGMCGMNFDTICSLSGDEQLKLRDSLVGKVFRVTADVKSAGLIYIRAAIPA